MASTQTLTPSGREAAGKEARRRAPRSIQGRWEPGPDRPDPVEILTEQDRTRVPDLIAIRHGRMLVSAFTFYRGAAGVMAADLGVTPRSGLDVQLCGDAHLSNFGVFAAPDRRLIFDINDFDETHPGPFEWDVKRLAASFAVAGRDRGFKKRKRRDVVTTAARAYREEMRRLAEARSIDVWYERVDLDVIEQYRSQVSRKVARNFDKEKAKAESKNSLRALTKLTRKENGDLRIISDPPLIVPIEELVPKGKLKAVETGLEALVEQYRSSLSPDIRYLADRYRFVDVAHKVVGVGSVGTRCWVVLMLGSDSNDPLFLQVKEAGPSVLAPFASGGRYKHQGRRVVEGQRLMQAASDVLLGWLTNSEGIDGGQRDFYVRQLWDGKGSAQIEQMTPYTMGLYAQLCGTTLARAHARSGDPMAIASYLGRSDKFDSAIADFAEEYADQNERDYEAFSAAGESGRIAVQKDI
ncbi:MAG TPA: DUF2252 domain-containing protein [Solirubrobacterales bacterium]|nr:DUF2252 domain-containing protein [Solirubrobacterales bacterium]